MQTNERWLNLIEKIRAYGLPHVFPQFIPRIALGENVFRKTFRNKASVRFVSNTENYLHF